jgi:hypothetical protein
MQLINIISKGGPESPYAVHRTETLLDWHYRTSSMASVMGSESAISAKRST